MVVFTASEFCIQFQYVYLNVLFCYVDNSFPSTADKYFNVGGKDPLPSVGNQYTVRIISQFQKPHPFPGHTQPLNKQNNNEGTRVLLREQFSWRKKGQLKKTHIYYGMTIHPKFRRNRKHEVKKECVSVDR